MCRELQTLTSASAVIIFLSNWSSPKQCTFLLQWEGRRGDGGVVVGRSRNGAWRSRISEPPALRRCSACPHQNLFILEIQQLDCCCFLKMKGLGASPCISASLLLLLFTTVGWAPKLRFRVRAAPLELSPCPKGCSSSGG